MDIDSILNLYRKNYFNLPRPVRSFLGSLYGKIPLEIRFGKQYGIHKEIIEKFESSNSQFQMDYMYSKTYETIQFAYENIPYYTKTFNEHNFRPNDFKSLDDLKMIPYLTKKIVQNSLDCLYTAKFDKPIAVQTGGSTFAPTRFYNSLNVTRAKERAYNNYIFSRIGYKYRDKTLVIREKAFLDEKLDIYWHYEMVTNQLWLSPNHLNSKFINKMWHEIEIFKPKYIWGYPHAIYLFAKECKKYGISKLSNISGVILTSEIILPEQLELISNFFGCHILSHYGHRESTAIAFRIDECNYHFLSSYGAVRILDKEIISTSFDNFVMPFINYKTQDLVTGEPVFFEGTGIAKSVQNVEGRLQDFLVMQDGTLRTALNLGMGHEKCFRYIDAAQYYQDTPGKITLKIESKQPQRVILSELKETIEYYIKMPITIDIQFVDKIEKTHIGKWKTVIQKLDIEKYI